MKPWRLPRSGRILALSLVFLTLGIHAQERDPRSVVELQSDRGSEALEFASTAGTVAVRLIDLNRTFHVWYVLEVQRPGEAMRAYHLESPRMHRQMLRLAAGPPADLLLDRAAGPTRCALGLGDPKGALEQARASGRAFAPLCDGRVFLRNPVAGHQTSRERVTDFLRDNIWNGEKITVFVRSNLYADAYLEAAKPAEPGRVAAPQGALQAGLPAPARVAPGLEGGRIDGSSLGIELTGAPQRKLALGTWYGTAGAEHVFVSAMQASAVAPEILRTAPKRVGPLDDVESRALVYLIAFDLAEFELGFAVGTEHPRVGWSARVPPDVVDPKLPGPDGFDTVAPLVTTGKVSPTNAPRTVATITGGFKRSHGAFKYGALSRRNRGSHYGFVEQGVVLSRMQPGLSSFYMLDDGSVHLENWTDAHAALTPRLLFARQNGVALVEWDAETEEPVPGPLVNQWGAGNWSGSQDSRLRALRSGFCLQESPAGRFLIYGYFSSATPSAMARVFQAYGCRHATHLDMNALEHTYTALYRRGPQGVAVEHLIDEMKVLDVETSGESVARFLGYADNRDFFYLMRRLPGDETP